ncbi:hypothetical protein ACFSTC_02215 [Nonomuraea ferruginea]
MVEGAYAGGMADFDEGMRDGSLLRGEVLARWQDFIGTGDFMRSLESRVGWLRDRIVGFFTGQVPENRLRDALESGVEALIRGSADAAAERALEGWSAAPGGAGLLDRLGAIESARLGRAAPRPGQADRAGGARLAGVRARPRTGGRRGEADHGARGVVRRERGGAAADAGRVRLDGRADRDRGGDRGRHHRAVAEAAGGDLRRPGGAHAHHPRPGGPAGAGAGGLMDEEAARFLSVLEPLEPSRGTATALLDAARTIRDHRTELPSGRRDRDLEGPPSEKARPAARPSGTGLPPEGGPGPSGTGPRESPGGGSEAGGAEFRESPGGGSEAGGAGLRESPGGGSDPGGSPRARTSEGGDAR